MAYPRWMVSGFLLLAAWAVQAQQGPVAANSPSTPVKLDKHKLSYAIGYRIGTQFSEGDFPIDMAVLQKAIEDAYAKRPPAVPKEDMYRQILALGERMHEQAMAEYNRIAVENARKSTDFLSRNAALPGVVQLPSGIQYSVIKKGDGTVNPSIDSLVTVNYRGMLIDGTEFDSTWAHGAPVSFTVDRVIRGWQYVIPRMHVGDRWKVVIPPSLAYGEHGALPRIGPNQALVFDIELLDIKPPSSRAAGP
ncbi:FKBP-type peptidyl-prolyl cis-trans isomerase [Dyella sp. M7H15-1]|uniref:FKBP-type peptidyl-prolyl cis-trans isomerase n=1 Tax=Dyella sp. M7H15-1 TaxID=2501295 RepID=UPI0010050608|nr:FKBP-type peptidyl-prolyl cis-trans isomerase [Dyella sp. M7H15-1]QAU22977.1 FKBP-type peptidyl-prolyl cis-trans isomerase [Dyella sp. M7H15-1]